MELKFPIEFIVRGTPVSSQAKRCESRNQWKDLVVAASRPALPEVHFATEDRVAVSMFYFPGAEMPWDVDNIIKYTLDALCQHIYIDDHQVERVVVQKFEPGRIFPFVNPSTVLLEALGEPGPLLYVRISDDPHEELNQ